MEISFIVVNNPRLRILPRWLRARLGEQYMIVDIYPKWTSDISQARRFRTYAGADGYINRIDGVRFAGMQAAIIRTVRDT